MTIIQLLIHNMKRTLGQLFLDLLFVFLTFSILNFLYYHVNRLAVAEKANLQFLLLVVEAALLNWIVYYLRLFIVGKFMYISKLNARILVLKSAVQSFAGAIGFIFFLVYF